MLHFAFLAMACAGGDAAPPPTDLFDASLRAAPAWVAHGCTRPPPRICGVGSSKAGPDPALRRVLAIGLARTEVAQELQSRLTAVLEDIAPPLPNTDAPELSGVHPGNLAPVTRQVTNMTISSTELLDTWVAQNATFYALVALDLDAFSRAVQRMTQISPAMREAITERAHTVFQGPSIDASSR